MSTSHNPTHLDNAPEAAHLSPDDRAQGELARSALSALRKTFSHWMVIARFVNRMRERADEIGGRHTYPRLLAQEGFGPERVKEIGGKATISRLEKIGHPDHAARVEEWHAKLPDHVRMKWAAPTTIMKYCPVFQPAAKEKPAKEKPTPENVAAAKASKQPDVSADEIARLRQRIAEQDAEIGRLKAVAAQHSPPRDGGSAEAALPARARTASRIEKDAKDSLASKLIRKLGDSDTLPQTVAALVRELAAVGADFSTLAKVWLVEEKKLTAKLAPPPKPIDFVRIEAIVTSWAEGKPLVNMNKVLKTVHDEMPGLSEQESHYHQGEYPVAKSITGCLRRLGFLPTKSGMSWQRAAPPSVEAGSDSWLERRKSLARAEAIIQQHAEAIAQLNAAASKDKRR